MKHLIHLLWNSCSKIYIVYAIQSNFKSSFYYYLVGTLFGTLGWDTQVLQAFLHQRNKDVLSHHSFISFYFNYACICILREKTFIHELWIKMAISLIDLWYIKIYIKKFIYFFDPPSSWIMLGYSKLCLFFQIIGRLPFDKFFLDNYFFLHIC